MDDERLRVRWPPRGSGVRQSGSGTVLVVALVAATVFGLLAILAVAAAVSAGGRAASAADLAALAGADAARGLSSGEPCGVAADVAARNGARLVDCRRSTPGGVVIDVWTSVAVGPGTAWLAGLGVEGAGRSRAGPPAQTWEPPG